MHASWSPSAIKSALMTTATAMKMRKKSVIKLCGSGLICIKKVIDSGLVYDIDGLDYIRLLRGSGCLDSDLYDYIEDELEKIGTDSLQPSDLNYPSFKAHLSDRKTSQVFRRRLKDVGFEGKMRDKVYKAYVTKCPKGVEITVKPRDLKFVKGQERNFEMHVAVVDWSMAEDNLFSVVLGWKNKQYTVRSPIIIERMISPQSFRRENPLEDAKAKRRLLMRMRSTTVKKKSDKSLIDPLHLLCCLTRV